MPVRWTGKRSRSQVWAADSNFTISSSTGYSRSISVKHSFRPPIPQLRLWQPSQSSPLDTSQRPLGGVVLSHIGDRFGRRRAFMISLIVMTVATLAMAAMPGYATIGASAAVLFAVLRFVQGCCVGGELPGAITYVVETSPNRAGLACGIMIFCVNTGAFLANVLSNLSAAIVGGFTPLIVSAISDVTGNRAAPGMFLSMLAGLGIVSVLCMKRIKVSRHEVSHTKSASGKSSLDARAVENA
ncbi:MFS transporter [Bradyrhizobium sp. USDA 4449]